MARRQQIPSISAPAFAARLVALARYDVERDAVDAHGRKLPAGVERHLFETAVLADQLQAFEDFRVVFDDFALSESDCALVACRNAVRLDFVNGSPERKRASI